MPLLPGFGVGRVVDEPKRNGVYPKWGKLAIVGASFCSVDSRGPIAVDIPNFPECDHDLVRSLYHLSDRDLLERFQQERDPGRYFTALFCRYSPIVYSLIHHACRSPVQADYLFALTWRHVLNELAGLDPHRLVSATADQPSFSLQNWIINVTALCINQAAVPEVEAIHYSLQAASPPFWCYVERALDSLPPTERLIVVMAQTFQWSDTRIAAYLQAEGEALSPAQVRQRLGAALGRLEAALPPDIQTIYLGRVGPSLADGLGLEGLDLADADWAAAEAEFQPPVGQR